MCGIAGIVSVDPADRTEQCLRGMLRMIEHRGPDDEGVVEVGDAALGARRLAVIDIAGGHQPISDDSGRVFAVQNGEIYNFQELRRELEDAGHRFRTRNDTEVLPHGYKQWGPAVIERLRGMFAIAIWDARESTLLLARDRFGKKPLFYAQLGERFLFGSSIQALLAHPAVPRDVDDRAIDDYLSLGYVPAPATAFRAIRKLRPAHVLLLRRHEVQIHRYWRLSYRPKRAISIDDAATELRAHIEDAVRVRLVSDVPLGAFLSGGLDSSTVVAFMAKHSARPVQTFSVGFMDRSYDELRYARLVAQAFGTDHHELVVDALSAEVLPELVRHLGEPMADSSIIPTYQVARITRPHVTVALNGDGGDEIFGGYQRYRGAAVAAMTVDRLPRGLARGLARAAQRLDAPLLPRVLRSMQRFVAALDRSHEHRLLHWTGYFSGGRHATIVGPKLRERARSLDAFRIFEAAFEDTDAEGPERYIAADIATYLPNDLLVKMDVATMAASLEGRSPLLDHLLAEFTARLPMQYKVRPNESKVLLRRAMTGLLPREILSRRKMGFTAPVAAWLRGPLLPLLHDTVLSSRAAERGYVSQTAARTIVMAHAEGHADQTIWLWNLLMLELWFRELVDKAAAPAPR